MFQKWTMHKVERKEYGQEDEDVMAEEHDDMAKNRQNILDYCHSCYSLINI